MKELVDRGEPVVGDSLYLFIPKVVSREKLVVKGRIEVCHRREGRGEEVFF